MSTKNDYEYPPTAEEHDDNDDGLDGTTPVAYPSAGNYDYRIAESDVVAVIVEDDDDDVPTMSSYNERSQERSGNFHHGIIGSRRKPTFVCCPNCAKDIKTTTLTAPNGVTWGCVIVGAIVFFPLCWLPLVWDPLKKTDHFCKQCGTNVGTVQPLEGCFVKEES